MLALRACIAPKTRRRGKQQADSNNTPRPAPPVTHKKIARSPPTRPAAGARSPVALATSDLEQAVTAHTLPHYARAGSAKASGGGGGGGAVMVRRNRSSSWETTDAEPSPQPFHVRCEAQLRESRADTRRKRHEVGATEPPEAAEVPPPYTPVARLEWSSSLSSAADSPCVRSGCSNTAPLPAGWRAAERDGASYYYNRRTGKRVWHHPSGCECPADTPLSLKTLSTASSAQASPAVGWTRSCSSDGNNTPHTNPGLPNAYYYKRGWHGAAPTLSLSTTSSANRTTSAGTAVSFGRTGSSATSASLPVSEPSPSANGKRAAKTYSVASTAAPYPPPPTPVSRGLLAGSTCRQSGHPNRRSIVKMLAALDRELLDRPSSPNTGPGGGPPQPPPMVTPRVTVSPAVVVEEGLPPPAVASAMAPRGRAKVEPKAPRSRRGSFAESVLSQPMSIPDEPSSSGAFSEAESSSSRNTRGDVADLGRGWALNQVQKRLSTKYENPDFEVAICI